MIDNINWYPGHMKKTREMIQQNMKMVDAVVEVVDARIPISSRNPVIAELAHGRPRIIVLNKSDLADDAATRGWKAVFETGDGTRTGDQDVVIMNSMSGAGKKDLYRVLESMSRSRSGNAAMKPYRLMIVGVPNVGKSSLINRMTGHRSARTGDKPGVTRGKQWLRLENGMQLLDTPGILWPKFEDPKAGINLAFCGSIKDEILDVPSLGMELVAVLSDRYPELLIARYGIGDIFRVGDESPETSGQLETAQEAALANMELIARKRGCILPGKRIDYERVGKLILDEFRTARIGRITLEWPEDRRPA